MKLLKTIKYKGQFHKRGSQIDIDKSDIDRFIKLGVIESSYKPLKEDKVQQVALKDKPLKNDLKPLQDDLTVAEIKVLLDNANIEYDTNLRKKDLLKLLKEV